ncbi:MAG: hypothetical protein IPM69_10335 [Ignavibacteria bacterium]|nr:hypothetical protein [Ignavibacteria bacterium]
MKTIVKIINAFAFNPDDTEETRSLKKLILVVSCTCSLCGVIWSAMYFYFLGLGITMVFPLLFAVIMSVVIPFSHWKRTHSPLVYAQLICITWLSAFIQWSLGSLHDSGIVILWSLLGAVGAILFLPMKKTLSWLAMFIVIVVVTAVIQPQWTNEARLLTDTARMCFYLMNLSIPSIVIFITVGYFVNSNQENIVKVKQTYSKLINSEKLAALGQVAAGIAHEVNTPMGAIKSSAEESEHSFNDILTAFTWLTKALSEEDLGMFMEFITTSDATTITLSTKEEREIRKNLRDTLTELGAENARFLADRLVQVGVHDLPAALTRFAKHEHFEKLVMLTYNILNQQRSNQTIQLAVDKASRIVKALKTYMHSSGNEEMDTIDLRDNIETVLTIYHNRLKQGVQVVKNYEDVPAVIGYADQLNQVWTNLIINSLQAMDNRGILTIGIKQEGDFITVSIKDTGNGIPAAIQSKIFDPFFTTKGSGEGSGLGLDIIKRILEEHNATISFRSIEGEGTTFYVQLPITKTT